VDAAILLSAAANVAVVVTLVIVVVQTRAMREQTREVSVQVALDGLQDLQALLVERPRLWPYFYRGVEPEDVPEELRDEVQAACVFYLTTVENLLSLPHSFLATRWEQWKRNVVRAFADSPSLRLYAETHAELLGPTLLALARATGGDPRQVRVPAPGARAARWRR